MLVHQWALNNFPNGKVRRTPPDPGSTTIKNTVDIFDEASGKWVTNTWHHHQNGKDLFLVPSKIHNANMGGFAHSGGEAIYNNGLEGIFPGPQL
jgi:hypothetical protein